jgi:hypothetical protein
MKWLAEKRFAARQFHDTTQIHNRNTIADMPDNTQVMGDKQVGKVELSL